MPNFNIHAIEIMLMQLVTLGSEVNKLVYILQEYRLVITSPLVITVNVNIVLAWQLYHSYP